MESNEIFGSTAKAEAEKAEKKPAVRKTVKKQAAKVNDDAKKPAVKAAAKKTTTKRAAKADTKTAEPEKTAAVKAETKAAKTETKAAKKPAADKPKRTYTKRAEVKNSVFIQFQGQQVDYDAIVKKVEEDCKRQKVKAKDLTLYIKPEDNACYYVANNGIAGKVDLY